MEDEKVVNMNQKHAITKLYLEGKSKSEIARTLDLTRDTVRKYIKDYEFHESLIEKANNEDEREMLILRANERPKYNTQNRKRYKVTDELIDRVKAMIDENEARKRSGQRKLVRKAIDMHEVLIEEGHDVSYRTVCDLVHKIIEKPNEAFIKQVLAPGEMAEFDWGEVTLGIDETDKSLRRYYIAVFTLRHSNHHYAKLYTLENTASFNDVHVSFFETIKGVPQEIVYDNARTAVKKFVQRQKEPTDALKRLMNYYGFEHRFTNAYSGHEKGAVERAVEQVRRKAFSGKQHFKTLQEAQAHLEFKVSDLNARQKQRNDKNASTAFAEEQAQLMPNRIPLDTGVLVEAHVNKYSFIYVDSNFYSVPDYLVGKQVGVKKYPFKLSVLYKDKVIYTHERIYGKNNYKVDIMHYLYTIKKKPGSIKRSLILRSSTDWLQHIFHTYYSTTPKDFVNLLELIKYFPLDEIKRIIETLEKSKRPIKTEIIRQHLMNHHEVVVPRQYEDIGIEQFAKSQLELISALYEGEERRA